MNLTSPAGKTSTGVINSVAEFERNLQAERTQTGWSRARAEGKALGRSSSLAKGQRQEVGPEARREGQRVGLAKEYSTSRQSIMRARGATYSYTVFGIHGRRPAPLRQLWP
jgi:putative DNA-invertase from lambdoid prophage Rac